jgi:hypothetical protein
MPSITITVKSNVRNPNKKIHNFSVLSHVSGYFYDKKSNGYISRDPKTSYNNPEWSFDHNTGNTGIFKKHNGYNDQERTRRKINNYIKRQGEQVHYFVKSYNPEGDIFYHEDPNGEIMYSFELPMLLSYQPENELYEKWGIQHTDEHELHASITNFFELHYVALKKAGIAPHKYPNIHNPIYYHRGYEDFCFHGYTAQQIFPKAGDRIKYEAFNNVYTIQSVKDSDPNTQHRSMKYFFKFYAKDSVDDSTKVSNDLLSSGVNADKYISELFGTQVLDDNGNVKSDYFLDSSKAVDKLKKDVLYIPPEVCDSPSTDSDNDITQNAHYHPGAEYFGKW